MSIVDDLMGSLMDKANDLKISKMAELFCKKFEEEAAFFPRCYLAQKYSDIDHPYQRLLYDEFCKLEKQEQDIVLRSAYLPNIQNDDFENITELKWSAMLLKNTYPTLESSELDKIDLMFQDIIRLKEMTAVDISTEIDFYIKNVIKDNYYLAHNLNSLDGIHNYIVRDFENKNWSETQRIVSNAITATILTSYWCYNWQYQREMNKEMNFTRVIKEISIIDKANVETSEDVALSLLYILYLVKTMHKDFDMKCLKEIYEFERKYIKDLEFYQFALYAYVYGRAHVDDPKERYIFHRDIYEKAFRPSGWERTENETENKSEKLKINKNYVIMQRIITEKYQFPCKISGEILFDQNYMNLIPIDKIYVMIKAYMPFMTKMLENEHKKLIQKYIHNSLKGISFEERRKTQNTSEIMQCFAEDPYIEVDLYENIKLDSSTLKYGCTDLYQEDEFIFGLKKELYLTFLTQALTKYGGNNIILSKTEENKIKNRMKKNFDDIRNFNENGDGVIAIRNAFQSDCVNHNNDQKNCEKLIIYVISMLKAIKIEKNPNPQERKKLNKEYFKLIVTQVKTVEDLVLFCIQEMCNM